VFIADDNEAVVEAIQTIVALDPSLEVVGHCDNGSQVLQHVQAIQPKVLVLDISLPGLNGLEVCGLVKSHVPQVRVLMLSMHTNEACVRSALERGASAFLAKESVATELRDAVHAIAQGKTYLGQGIPAIVVQQAQGY
jgi:DNA-binding NarL/FixJ family response regulator